MVLGGCANPNNKSNIIYETTAIISNIDPQFATNETELQIVYNIFEGLTKYNKSGELELGVAESYSVSKDGLTYNFKIKDNVKWSDGRPLIADDFVFSFKKAVNPETASPYAATLLPIKNASKILSGKKAVDEIGVVAISDSQLQIELDYASEEFLDLLTTPVAMPCNEEFFNDCKGYYGLNDEAVISNGCYYLSAWNEEFCSLKKNKEYEFNDIPSINSVYIYFNSEDELFENMQKSEPDFTILNNALIEKLINKNIAINPTHLGNTTHSLIINPKSNLAEKNILKALMSTVSFSISNDFIINHGISYAKSILPNTVDFSEEIICNKSRLDSEKQATEKFIEGCENLNIERIFPSFSIVYFEDEITKSVAQQIAAKWQNIFGVSVNITAIESFDILNSSIQSGNYDVAIIPTTAISSSPTSYFQQFTSNSTTNYLGYKNKKFDALVKKMNNHSGEQLKITTTKAANILNDYKYIYPLFISSKTYHFNPDINIKVNSRNQKVYFSHID